MRLHGATGALLGALLLRAAAGASYDVQWDEMTHNASWTARGQAMAVVLDERAFLLGGTDNLQQDEYYNDVWATGDGVNWEQVTDDAPWSGRVRGGVAVMDGLMYLLGGRSYACYSDVWSSANGATWTEHTDEAAWGGRYNFEVAVLESVPEYGGQSMMLVMGGAMCFPPIVPDTNYNDVYGSTDGETWTQLTAGAQWSTRSGFASAVVNGSTVYVMGGVTISDTWGWPVYLNDVWQSTNGANWTLVTGAASWEARVDLSLVMLGAQFFVLGGATVKAEADTAWGSDNGFDWFECKPSVPFGDVADFASYSMHGDVFTAGGLSTSEAYASVWRMSFVGPSLDDDDHDEADALEDQVMEILMVVALCGAVAVVVALLLVRLRSPLMARIHERSSSASLSGSWRNSTLSVSSLQSPLLVGPNGGRLMSALDVPIELHVPREQLSIGSKIAAGATGQVFRGRLSGSPVAVKELFNSLIDPSYLDEFYAEMAMLRHLRHPNIVSFYGVAVSVDGPDDDPTPHLYLVTEFAPHCLKNVLADPDTELTGDRLRQLAFEIASGMQYIHSKGVIHRDLKSSNLLIDDSGHIKICDMGTCKLMDLDNPTMTGQRGSPMYMAPEVIEGRTAYTSKADIYSFGVVMWELACRDRPPYPRLTGYQIMEKVLRGDLRPDVPDSWPETLKALVRGCWSAEPALRPTFEDLLGPLSDEGLLFPVTRPLRLKAGATVL